MLCSLASLKCSEIHPRQHVWVGGAPAQVCFWQEDVGSVWAGWCAGGVFRWGSSAILCISLTWLALNGARTRGQGRGLGGPPNDGWHCWEQWRLMLIPSALCLLHLSPLWLCFGPADFHWSNIQCCENSFITLWEINNHFFLSDPLKITSDSFWKGQEMMLRCKWADLKEVKAA